MAALQRGFSRCSLLLSSNNLTCLNSCRSISVSSCDLIKRKWISKWKNSFPEQVYSEEQKRMDKTQIKGYKSVPIMKAVLLNNFDCVKSLILQQNDLCSYVHKKSGDSPLILASRLCHGKILELLIQFGADIEHKNLDGKRALHEAANSGCEDIVSALIKQGAKVDVLKRADWTPLMFACVQGHLGCVKILCEHGADLHRINKDGWTCLHLACREGHLRILEYLVDVDDKCCSTSSKNGRTPLHTACMHGQFSVTEFLLDLSELDIMAKDSCGSTPFLETIRFRNTDISDLLIAKNVNCLYDKDNLGKSAVHAAAQSGHVESLKYLIEKHSVDVDIKSDDSLMTALHFSAKEGHEDALLYLISRFKSLDAIDKFGRTALHLSIAANKLNTTSVLIQSGADVTVLDSQQKTAKDYALSNEMKYLIDKNNCS